MKMISIVGHMKMVSFGGKKVVLKKTCVYV